MNAQDKNLEPSAEAAPGREDAPQRFEVGKSYRSRDGKQVFKVVGVDSGASMLPITAIRQESGAKVYFSAEGLFQPRLKKVDEWDLVSPAAQAAPAQVMELDALLADYGLAFQHAGWDWRVKLDAAKAKIIEWVARSQTSAAPEPSLGALDDLKLAFLTGFSAGHSAGVDAASDDPMRHSDSPTPEQAWEEFVAARSEGPR